MDIIDTIFIDTSVFISEGYFKSTGRVSKLFDLAKQGYIRILLPVITENEWFKHFQAETKLDFPDVGRKLSLIGANKKVEEFLEQYSELTLHLDFDEQIKKSFEKYINGPGITKIDYPYFEDRLRIVFEKYFENERPFGCKGKRKEFPDAFVLAGLEKYGKENGIDKIVVFAKDNDIKEYRSDILKVEDIGVYLDDVFKNRIEIANREQQSKDIDKLFNFMKDCPILFKQDILDKVEWFLCNPNRFSHKMHYAEIEDVYDVAIDVEMTPKDMEIISITEDEIEAVFFPEVEGSVSIKYFDDDNSLWDPEDKEWIIKSYANKEIEISSYLTITVKMNRKELTHEQELMVDLLDVDFDMLQDSIDDDMFYV